MRITSTGPKELPLTLDIIKAHLRQDEGAGELEDALLLVYARGAVAEAERATRRRIFRQQVTISGVEAAREIELPMYPVESISRVSSSDGEVDPGDYTLTEDIPQRLAFSKAPPGPLLIDLEVGHSLEQIPEDLLTLILLLIGHRYENREGVVVGVSATALPRAIHDLIWLLRVGI